MYTLINWIAILLVIVFAVSITFGVNLKKWYGWLQVLFGFLLGLAMGSVQNIYSSLGAGIFFAILTIWIGRIRWKQRQMQ